MRKNMIDIPSYFFSHISELNFTADELDLKELSLDIPETQVNWRKKH